MRIALTKPKDVPGRSWPAIVIGLFVAFGGILFGYDTGTISGIIAMDYWKVLFSDGTRDANGNPDVSASNTAAIVSILSAGTFFGALSAAPFADFLGRRFALVASSIVFSFGVILQTAATAIPLFLAGRFFAGFGVGLVSALIPLYQSETAPKWIRGVIVGAYQLAITIGLLLAAVVDNATANRNDTGSYRIPIAVQFAFAIILGGGMLFLPETPRYLVKRVRHDKAARSLARLRRLGVDHPAIVQELNEIEANHEYELHLGKATYLDCFRGITNAFVIQMITSAVNVASTLPGLYAIDKFGRRPLLLWGAVGMAVSQLLVAVLGTTTTSQDVAGNIIVHNVAAQKAGIAFIWLFNWAIAYSTPYLVKWGPGNANLQSKIFFIWFGCCFLCIAFVYFFIYETKGLTLEQIDELYDEVSVAKNSVGWVPTKTFVEKSGKTGAEEVEGEF
ncbi:Plasma membrane low glucose sensor [Pseudogymnoascus australis]